MKYNSVFDIIGPVMVGPSSSHTAGAVKLGRMARSIFGVAPEKAKVTFYGSFASTYKGHGTDVALVGGLLNMSRADARIPDAMEIAKQENLTVEILTSEERTAHPNTVKIFLQSGPNALDFTGISIGGGMVDVTNINGFPVHIDGENPVMLVLHEDQPGIIARVTARLAVEHINISQMAFSRKARGENALMIISTDVSVPAEIVNNIEKVPGIDRVIQVD